MELIRFLRSAQTFYTKDAFSSAPKHMLSYTSRCLFAHDKAEYAKNVDDSLVYCVAFEPPAKTESTDTLTGALSSLFAGMRTLRESRLYSSFDFFDKDTNFVDLGIGKEARGVVGIGGVQKYLVTALKPMSAAGGQDSSEMVLYVTEDGFTWSRALFPHGHGLKENAYTIVESTEHSILVDVNSSPGSKMGTLFTSNSNGTYFVRSLEHTNRNKMGIVDVSFLLFVLQRASGSANALVDAFPSSRSSSESKESPLSTSSTTSRPSRLGKRRFSRP